MCTNINVANFFQIFSSRNAVILGGNQAAAWTIKLIYAML